MVKSFILTTDATKGCAMSFDSDGVKVGNSKFAGIIDASFSGDIGSYKKGDIIPVTLMGCAKACCAGTVSVGDDVAVDTKGFVKKAGTGEKIIGVFLTNAVDGDYVEILIDRLGKGE
ncbi:MAG: structural cement protein Gp24 [Treponemataceae bacterium]